MANKIIKVDAEHVAVISENKSLLDRSTLEARKKAYMDKITEIDKMLAALN